MPENKVQSRSGTATSKAGTAQGSHRDERDAGLADGFRDGKGGPDTLHVGTAERRAPSSGRHTSPCSRAPREGVEVHAPFRRAGRRRRRMRASSREAQLRRQGRPSAGLGRRPGPSSVDPRRAWPKAPRVALVVRQQHLFLALLPCLPMAGDQHCSYGSTAAMAALQLWQHERLRSRVDRRSTKLERVACYGRLPGSAPDRQCAQRIGAFQASARAKLVALRELFKGWGCAHARG